MFELYDPCICGSGKKTKWCCHAIIPQIQKLVSLAANQHFDQALVFADKLISENVNVPFVKTMKMETYFAMGKFEEAQKIFEEISNEAPDYALPIDYMASFMLRVGNIGAALDLFDGAIERYSPEATTHISRALHKRGICQLILDCPNAAWADFQQALKLTPGEPSIEKDLNERIKGNEGLPNIVRQGLRLKSPDEFAVFKEERREKWDEAMRIQGQYDLVTLSAIFDSLVADDKQDAAACYNSAVVHAWLGENLKAIEALEQYAKSETDFEAVANAWELCEVLRCGRGAESVSDNMVHIAFYNYATQDPPLRQLLQSKRCRPLVVHESQEMVLCWYDEDLPDNADVSGHLLVRKEPKLIARVRLSNDGIVAISRNKEDSNKVRAEIEAIMQATITMAGDGEQMDSMFNLDREAAIMLLSKETSQAEMKQAIGQSMAKFYEEQWPSKPLRSLSGLSPIDAAQSRDYQRKLEGVIRFREQLSRRSYEDAYDFDRLRKKLGLVVPSSKEAADEKPDISTMTVAQLTALHPNELKDEELVSAYRAAGALDAPRTALNFAEEMIKRDSVAPLIDLVPVFRRLVQDRIERNKRIGLADLIESGIDYDRRNYKGANWTALEALRAHVLLTEGEVNAAGEAYRRVFEKKQEDLEVVAAAVEKLLSAGAAKLALEFAKLGLERAERFRKKDFQSQFREYVEDASRRKQTVGP